MAAVAGISCGSGTPSRSRLDGRHVEGPAASYGLPFGVVWVDVKISNFYICGDICIVYSSCCLLGVAPCLLLCPDFWADLKASAKVRHFSTFIASISITPSCAIACSCYFNHFICFSLATRLCSQDVALCARSLLLY